MKSANINLHLNELDDAGVDIQPISEAGYAGIAAHRDDHYMFVIQQRGTFLWEVDFNKSELSGSMVSFITPGQVHRYIDYVGSTGWLVFVDSELVATDQRELFDTFVNMRLSSKLYL